MLLFAPGPINVPEIARVIDDPPYFPSKEFSYYISRLQSNMKELLQLEDHYVLFGAGSGSTAMESCVLNFFNPGDTVIVINNGKYGDNWVKMCQTHDLKVIELKAPWGEIVSPVLLDNYLQEFSDTSDIKGLLVVHVETTTGALNPVEEYNSVLKQHNPTSLCIVDIISSFLSERTPRGVDVLITASQKGLSCDPGLFFMAVNSYALTVAESLKKPRSFYFNILQEYNYQIGRKTTRFTPAAKIVVQCTIITTYILSHYSGLHTTLATVKGRSLLFSATVLKFNRFKIFPTHPSYALTVLTFNGNANSIINELSNRYNIVVGKGLRDYAGSILRIRHFGVVSTKTESETHNIVRKAFQDIIKEFD